MQSDVHSGHTKLPKTQLKWVLFGVNSSYVVSQRFIHVAINDRGCQTTGTCR